MHARTWTLGRLTCLNHYDDKTNQVSGIVLFTTRLTKYLDFAFTTSAKSLAMALPMCFTYCWHLWMNKQCILFTCGFLEKCWSNRYPIMRNDIIAKTPMATGSPKSVVALLMVLVPPKV